MLPHPGTTRPRSTEDVSSGASVLWRPWEGNRSTLWLQTGGGLGKPLGRVRGISSHGFPCTLKFAVWVRSSGGKGKVLGVLTDWCQGA
jgi:hypothetical protein